MEARKVPPLSPPIPPRVSGAVSAANGGAAPRSVASILASGFLGKSALEMGRAWFTTASREQLHELARLIAENDRDRALQMSALLAWEATGREPQVKPLSSSVLASLAQASSPEIAELGSRLVGLDLVKAHELYAELGRALATHHAEFEAWMKAKPQ